MNTLTLPTGRVLRLDQLAFDATSQRAYYGQLDVTDYLTRAQLQAVGGSAFDVERANSAASDAARLAAGEAPYTNGAPVSYVDILSNTVKGIGNDVASAAQTVRDFAGIGPENAGKHSPLFWFALLAGVGYLLNQLGIFAWLRKKLSA